MTDRPTEAAKERGWRAITAIDAALDRGEIDEQGWHRAMAELVVPAYLAADNPRAQSGHSGDEKRWKRARSLLVDAIDRDGTFLDVGCASGLLALRCGEVGSQPAGVDRPPVFEATMAREEHQVVRAHCHRIAADCRVRRRKCNVYPWAHRLDRDRVIASSDRRPHGRIGNAVAWKLTKFEEHMLKAARNHQGEEPSPAGCSVA